MSKPELCLVFDLDDTLYPEATYNRSGLRAAGDWAERELGLTGLGEVFLGFFEAGRQGDIFDAGLQARGHPPDPVTIARLVAAYRAHAPDLALYEDAVWAIVHYGAHLPLGMVTDGYAQVQQAKVSALGIAERFRRIVYTDALGGRDFWKPSPAGFEAIERAVPEIRDFAYVADNPAKDFVAPNARGWRTFQIVRPCGTYRASQPVIGGEPQRIITSLRQLPDLLGF